MVHGTLNNSIGTRPHRKNNSGYNSTMVHETRKNSIRLGHQTLFFWVQYYYLCMGLRNNSIGIYLLKSTEKKLISGYSTSMVYAT